MAPRSEDEAVETSTAQEVSKNEAVAVEQGMWSTLWMTVLCETLVEMQMPLRPRSPRTAVRSGICSKPLVIWEVGTETRLGGEQVALGRRAVMRVGEAALCREPVATRGAASPSACERTGTLNSVYLVVP